MKFRIVGNVVPAVEVYFEQPGEEMITQSGGMAWMSDGISMTTDTNGGALAGLGRMFAGESIFMAHYKAIRPGSAIAFATTVPGKVVPVKMKDGCFSMLAVFCEAKHRVYQKILIRIIWWRRFCAGEAYWTWSSVS